MNKIKFSLLVIVAALLAGNALFAQSVDQGKTFYYYERYKSAREQFEQVLNGGVGNAEAVYWLGQTLIAQKDIAGARALYEKALAANPNAALVLVGTGHMELIDGKTNEARQHFETAISVSKGKNVDVLNAIGKANAQTKAGDAQYAVAKLIQAEGTKNFNNNTETYLYMGDAFRKQMNGSEAAKSYIKAMRLNPSLAAPKFKLGMLYRTQNDPNVYLPHFTDALDADPAYAPALYELYYYWYSHDINKAIDYYTKYKAATDAVPANDYEEASIRFASKDYNGAIDQAKSDLAKYGDKADPRYYKLIAYSYDAMADSVSAKNYLDQYFSKQTEDGFVPKDYSFKGLLLTRIPGADPSEAFRYYQMAVDKDTVVAEKIKLLREAVDVAKKNTNKPATAQFAGQLYMLNPNPTNNDLYNWGHANYSAGNYQTADSIFCGVYQSKYPDQIYGYLWCAKSKQAQDTTNEKGLAVEAYNKLGEFASAKYASGKETGASDTATFKNQAVQAYFFLATYYNDIKKDKQAAIHSLEQVLVVDPNNTTAARFIKILADAGKKEPSASVAKPAAQAPRSGAAKK